MTNQELEDLLTDVESERVERKASLQGDAPTKARQTICAFANDMADHRKPGVLFVGAHDDGTPSGITVDDRLLLQLADMRDDGNILPLPTMTIEKRSLLGGDMAVVTVQPSLAPPVRYKGQVWIRTGPRLSIASAEDEKRLAERRRGHDLPFELCPAPLAGLDDLDLRLFDDYVRSAVDADMLRQNDRSVEQRLIGLRFAVPFEEKPTPTNLGTLVLGLDPRKFVPGAYVQFVRIDGDALDAPITDQKEIAGPLLQVMRRLDEVLELSVSTRTDITSGRTETRYPDYPLPALQQITRNALMHRTYEGTNAPTRILWFSDRVEVHSPGGPFGIVSRSFGKPGLTDYRNPGLAEVMKNLGYVQRFGVGISVTRKAMADNGNPEPEFVDESTHVLVVLRRRP